MWKRDDYTGNKIITLYEEDEYKELEEKLVKYKDMLYNIYKAHDTCTPIDYIEDYIEDELLEEFYERREKEWNAESADLIKASQDKASLSINAKDVGN